MSTTRGQAEAYVARVLGELLALARVFPADISGGLREPLDDAFRAVGEAGKTSVDDSLAGALLAHAEYRTLLRIHRALLLTPATDPQADARRDRIADVRSALDGAKTLATEASSGTATVSGFGSGSIGLGIYGTVETA